MENKDSSMMVYLRYSTMGIEMGVTVLGGLFLGRYLDRRFDTAPWLLLTGLLLGLLLAARNIFRMIRQMQREMKDK
ncbi:MAG: AtpZ/AtpI family protein [Deltaproteobacteria bacterium]|nr:AtpZ/AtpI family protein [Deltaproteobacteria bacterium]